MRARVRRRRGTGSVYKKHGNGCTKRGCDCPWWIAYFRPDGTRLQRSSGSHRKEDAVRLLDEIERDPSYDGLRLQEFKQQRCMLLLRLVLVLHHYGTKKLHELIADSVLTSGGAQRRKPIAEPARSELVVALPPTI